MMFLDGTEDKGGFCLEFQFITVIFKIADSTF